MANKSVERFRLLAADLQKQVLADAISELNQQAEDLRKSIEDVAPVYQGPPIRGVVPGALKHTVSVVPDRSKATVVRIVAGGYQTVRSSLNAKPFDYARADEFGTQKMAAQPFFFPTYRLMKKKIIAKMKRRLAARIKQYSAEDKGSTA